MARIRTVKPDFFRHELLQDLEITHAGKCPMLVFAGLFGHCDKAGRFEWKPRMLKLDILPFVQFEMTETLAILEKAGLIEKYSVDGVEYGSIPTFTDHQRIGGKEAQDPEKYPAPKVCETLVNPSGSNGEALGKHQGLQEGKGREGNRKGSKALASSAKALSAAEPLNGNAVAYIPINDGTEFGVSPDLAAELSKLYPAVDVPQTLNEIRAWNLANPQRRKTKRGVLQHINSWLSKEQNRGPQGR